VLYFAGEMENHRFYDFPEFIREIIVFQVFPECHDYLNCQCYMFRVSFSHCQMKTTAYHVPLWSSSDS